jgi:23S rRNA pseudouridine2605 synthase
MPRKRERKPNAGPSALSPEGERIAKVMARAGLCSRREAEAWIAAGRVTVNDAKIASPALNVKASDRIVVDGTPLPVPERTRLFLYNKPRGLVTTNADPEGRPTIFSALPKGLPRLVTVGRLDMNTEGLLLLTNDGGLARVLELPETGWLRRYRVRAHGAITQPQLDALRRGVTIDGIRYGEIEATLDRAQGANVWLTFAIREGKNREVRNVLEHLGLKVNRLIRVSYGPFQLGDLADGAVEEIRTRHLREQLGARIAEAAGADFTGPMSLIPEPEQRRHPEAAAKRPSKGGGASRHPHATQDNGEQTPEAPRRAARFAGGEKNDKRERGRRWEKDSGERRRTDKRGRERAPSTDGERLKSRRPDRDKPFSRRDKPKRWDKEPGARKQRSRHPDARAQRASKEDGTPSRPVILRGPREARAPQDDGARRNRPPRHGPFRAPSGGKGKRK